MKLMPSEVVELALQTGVAVEDIELIAEAIGCNRASIVLQATMLRNERESEIRKHADRIDRHALSAVLTGL